MIEKLGSLVELVESIVDELEAAAIPYALGGAIAYSAWGEPRATRDIDLNVWLDIERFEPAFAALERCGVTIDREHAVAEARERGMFVARARDYRIDVFVPSVDFYDEALRQRRRVQLAGRETWVLAPESLAVFKMLFFRPKDLADIGRILEIQGSAFDRAYVRRWLVDMLETRFMETVNVYEAKTHLSRLLERAEAGEEIIITRHGRPVARLGPVRVRKERRKLGLMAGRIRMAKDFDEPLSEDVLAAFEGSSS